MNRRLYIAAYDIANPRRLRLALQLVKAYATGGQKSAYECWLNDAEKAELLLDMALALDEMQDSFMLIGLDPRGRVRTLGIALAPVDPDIFYIH